MINDLSDVAICILSILFASWIVLATSLSLGWFTIRLAFLMGHLFWNRATSEKQRSV